MFYKEKHLSFFNLNFHVSLLRIKKREINGKKIRSFCDKFRQKTSESKKRFIFA